MEKLHQKHQGRDVRVLIIDVNENRATAKAWTDGHNLTFPILLDTLGEVSASYAPEGVLPDLPRHQIPIGSNLLLDREGRIQFYSLLDTKNFDARLVAVQKRLKSLMEAEVQDSSTTAKPAESDPVSIDPVELVTLKKGASATTTVSFTIKDSFHVLADDGGERSLIPLRIDLGSAGGITVGEPAYPESETLSLLGSELTLGVYSGRVTSSITLSADSDAAPGQRSVEGRLVFQSCNEHSCFPPDSLPVLIPVMIVD